MSQMTKLSGTNRFDFGGKNGYCEVLEMLGPHDIFRHYLSKSEGMSAIQGPEHVAVRINFVLIIVNGPILFCIIIYHLVTTTKYNKNG